MKGFKKDEELSINFKVKEDGKLNIDIYGTESSKMENNSRNNEKILNSYALRVYILIKKEIILKTEIYIFSSQLFNETFLNAISVFGSSSLNLLNDFLTRALSLIPSK